MTDVKFSNLKKSKWSKFKNVFNATVSLTSKEQDLEGISHGTFTFLTNSKYHGYYDERINTIAKMGSYQYPDGSVYKGYFDHGQFHGYGTITLRAPYNTIIKGTFHKGHLVKIEDIMFSDGVRLKGDLESLKLSSNLEDIKLNCNKWSYLKPKDRTYVKEKKSQIRPVGPTAYVTTTRPARDVGTMSYDTEEGIFRANSGWLVNVNKPSYSRFIGCKCEENWIKKHCRKSDDINENENGEPLEPDADICKQILHNNLRTFEELKNLKYCNCQESKQYELDKYFLNINHDENCCNFNSLKENLQVKDHARNYQYQIPTPRSSSSKSSFTDVSATVNMTDMCKDVRKKNRKIDPVSSTIRANESVMIVPAAATDANRKSSYSELSYNVHNYTQFKHEVSVDDVYKLPKYKT